MQEIKKGWKNIKFRDLYADQSRNGLTRPKAVRGEGYKMVNMGELFANDRIFENIDMELVKLSNVEIDKFSLKKYDLLFARQSLTLAGAGKCSIYLGENEIVTFESHIIRVRLNNEIAFGGYFYYYFSKGLGRNTIVSLINQVAAAGIRGSELSEISVLLPPLLTQQKIASILCKYDDLIENNNKRIKILEETAQSIYEEWFVKYNFPGSENIKMIDSGNDDFGMIPEGWKVKKVEDYVDFIRGVEPGSKNYKEIKGEDDIVFIRVGDLGNRNSGIYIDNDLSKGKIVTEKDVLVTFDGTVGIVKRGFYGCYSTGIRKLSGKKDFISNYFLYLLFKSEQIQNKIKEHAKGTTILHAGESIKYMEFVLATEDMYKKYNDIVGKVLDEILNIEKQNQNLKETRDLLIPRLVSGELDVESLDVK